MRIKNSIYNIASNYIVFFIKIVLTFLVRSVLIEKVSQTYIGLNGLFSNILSILSLAELGLSSAIGFSLYKPIMEKDNQKISTLMTFFKNTYKKIGTIILGLGVLLIPFLPMIVKENVDGMYLIYFLFLINTCSMYFISYKDILISSDQKSYKLTRFNLVFTILISLMELIVLYLTSNFILYLIVQFFIGIIQRFFINRYIGREYNEIDFNSYVKLDENTKKDLYTNVKAMCYHTIGDRMINATDNIIISTCINIDMVSIYSNYLLVTTYLMTFANMIYNGILASLGNFLITENQERKYEMFQKTNFLGFSIFSFCTVVLVNIFNIFIEILANESYVLPIGTVLIIILNFYITGMRMPSSNMKMAAGIFDVDKYTPLIQSVVNIVFSVLLAIPFGITGVLLGTLISSLHPSIQRPCIVYNHILKKSRKEYFKEYVKYFLFTFLCAGITYIINLQLNFSSLLVSLIIKGIIAVLIYLILYVIVFNKNQAFLYFKEMVLKIIRRDVNE